MIATGKRTLVATIVALIICAGRTSTAALSDCHEATCRITAADGGHGSGCAFGKADGVVYVLTNAHVATSETLEVEFWSEGHKSRPLRGRLAARAAKVDAAVVAVSESQFAGVLPKIIPIAESDRSPRPGDSVMSVGCAGGSWSTGWKGHVLGYSGADMYFVPPPANGRSGSAIFDANGEKIVGLLKARTGDDSTGIASSLPSLYRAFNATINDGGSSTTTATEDNKKDTQCPGGSCPSPWRLSPYRQQQDERIDHLRNQRQQVWPTLPQAGTQSIDLSPTNEKLDRIADLLIEMGTERIPQPAPPVIPSQREVERDIDMKVDAAVEQATAESRQATAEIKQATGKMREVVDSLIGDRETLRERFDERIEKVKSELGEDAQRRDIARAYVKDLASEKLSQGTLAFSGGKVMAGALGLSGPLSLAIGMGLWFLSRRAAGKVESGDPLLVQRMFDRVSDKVDALRDRLADRPADIANDGKVAK